MKLKHKGTTFQFDDEEGNIWRVKYTGTWPNIKVIISRNSEVLRRAKAAYGDRWQAEEAILKIIAEEEEARETR